MDKFSAIADSNRRRIMEMLSAGGKLSSSEISGRFSVSPSAVSQHLKVLRDSGLIKVEKRQQQRLYEIDSEALDEVVSWVRNIRARWENRFTRMEKLMKG